MPHTYTPSGTRNATITLPDDGDAANVASINTPMQQLSEEVELIAQHVPGGSVGTSTAFQVPLNIFANASDRFAVGGVGLIEQVNVTDAGGVLFWVPTVMTCKITAVRMAWKGAPAHANLPGTMPKIELLRFNSNSNTYTSIGSQTDPSGATVAYQANHNVDLTGLAEVVSSQNYWYYLSITGEAGANALQGSFLSGLWVYLQGV